MENVIIPAGTNKIRLYFDKGGSNVSLFHFLNPVAVYSVPFNFISGSTNTEGTAVILTLNKAVTTLNATNTDFEVQVNGEPLDVGDITMNPDNSLQITISLQNEIIYGQTVTVSYTGDSVISDSQALVVFNDKPVKNNLPRRVILPATIQAEDFDVNYGFQLEECTDVNGGYNVGFANNGDYLDYNIYIPEPGEYTFRFRIASLYSNGSISVRLGNEDVFNPVKTINFAGTGGWQNWTTQAFNMTLPEGKYTLRLFSLSGEYNINWFEISLSTDVNEIPNLEQFRIYPNPAEDYFLVEAAFRESTPVHFAIFDMLGHRLVNYRFEATSSFTKLIDSLDYKPGVYFLNISTELGSLTRKVVVN